MAAIDEKPTWRDSNNGRPHRLTANSIVELPFGKKRRYLTNGVLAGLLAGFQVGVMYEYHGTDCGKVTQDSGVQDRFVQVQARLRF